MSQFLSEFCDGLELVTHLQQELLLLSKLLGAALMSPLFFDP